MTCTGRERYQCGRETIVLLGEVQRCGEVLCGERVARSAALIPALLSSNSENEGVPGT